MSALDNAKKLGRTDCLEKIKSAKLEQYGLRNELLFEVIEAVPEYAAVDVGLDNADIDRVLLNLIQEDSEKVLEGMQIAAYLTGTQNLTLYLPEGSEKIPETLSQTAGLYGIHIDSGIIDAQEMADHLVMHIVTAIKLAELFDGTYDDGVYISTDGKILFKTAPGTKVADLVDLNNAKAVWMGYQYYTKEDALCLTAKDAINGLILMLTDRQCIVQDIVERVRVYRKVSCGKCVFCREGLIQLEYEQKEIQNARGKMEYLDLAREICEPMGYSTLCTVGKESAQTVLSAIDNFKSEYEAHIKKNQCPAGVCTSFVHIYINPQLCTGCGECLDVCPADCIDGKPKYIHMIDEFDCTRCGKCLEVCDERAIIQGGGKLPKLPDRLTKVGRFRKH